ncbi:MAG TPA: hypothetical protein VIM70_03740 [Clostridium sp.]|uniref:hypothetical protein n=1 Tax=Clostridium sp. TaxID=1506 RepID=UPI002F920266
MARTIYFYNVGIYLNEVLTDVSLLHFIDSIDKIQSNRFRVVRKVDKKICAIFKFIPHSEKNVRVIPIGKFRRDFKPFIGELAEAGLAQIDKDVIELLTLYYDDTYKLMCIPYSQNGLKVKDIQNYFNTYFPNKTNMLWEIKFHPVIINKGIEKIKNSSRVKSLSLELNLDSTTKKFIKDSTTNEFGFIKALSTSVEEDLSANTLKIEFGVKKKSDTMQLNAIMHLISLLNLDTDYISKLIVTYKDNTTQEMDNLNLKDSNALLKDKILSNSKDKNPALQIISLEIKKTVEKQSSNIIRAFRNYWVNVTNDVMPDLVFDPYEENRIELKTNIENELSES